MRQVLTALLLATACFSFAQSQQQLVDSLVYGTNGIKFKFSNIGIVIGIYQNGKTNYYSFGTRFTDRPELVDSTTIFEIGSATKTFTALLLAEAIQDKKAGRNDFIDNYLPKGFHLSAALKNKIKLTDLASHKSGLPNLSNDTYFEDLLKKDPGNPFRFVDSAYCIRCCNKQIRFITMENINITIMLFPCWERYWPGSTIPAILH